MDIFEFIDTCWLKDRPVTPEQNQPDEIFMATKWLSLAGTLVVDMAKVSRLQAKLPRWAVACLLYHLIPKVHRPPRFKYPKKGLPTNRPLSTTAYKVLQERFNCKSHHAEQIQLLLEKQGVSLDSVFGQLLYKK